MAIESQSALPSAVSGRFTMATNDPNLGGHKPHDGRTAITVARDQVIDLVSDHPGMTWKTHVHCQCGSSRAMRRTASDFI